MSLRNKNKTKAGFSLVELMMVIAIILIMTGVILVVGPKSGASQDAEAAAQQIAAQLRVLQNDALAGKRIKIDATNYKSVCQFHFKTTQYTYSIVYDSDCSSTSEVSIGSSTIDVTKKRVKLTPDLDIVFDSPRGKANAPKQVKVTSSRGDSYYRIVDLSASGNVTITQ